MDQSEFGIHSFIVKIWLEETVEEAGQATWRGVITHIPGGEQRYVKDLEEVLDLIKFYLEKAGVQFNLRWRVRRWLKWKICHSKEVG